VTIFLAGWQSMTADKLKAGIDGSAAIGPCAALMKANCRAAALRPACP
jgi:hypothetical protein